MASGICSSDLLGVSFGPEPVTLGHEFSARTPTGATVAVLPNAPCGACDLCLAGREQLCRVLRPTIHGFFRDGGMADAVVVEPSSVVALPPGVDGHDACLVEPLAVALHAVHRLDPQAGARVLVVGAGAIGLSCVAVLPRPRGACRRCRASRPPAPRRGRAGRRATRSRGSTTR